MINRRNFVIRAAGGLGMLAVSPETFASRLNKMAALTDLLDRELTERGPGAAPELIADDEKFWTQVRAGYDLNPDLLNLDHGWTNPTIRAATDELARGARQMEALPAAELSRLFYGNGTAELRPALAEAMGVPVAEIALVRNATEALNTVLLGFPLKAGDEIVCSAHDYFATLDALEQRQARDGVVLRMVKPPIPAPSMQALAELYEAAIGPRTKLVLVTHPSNLTGQLYPVQQISTAAHRVGAEVVVDGAQSLGIHGADPISALGCDYYGASAHKWLGTPVGLGILWMRPAHVPKIWPLAPPPARVTGMRRFEWVGTGPEYLKPAALVALGLHRSLGASRKAARLQYLRSYLRTRLTEAIPGTRFYTREQPGMSVNITTIELPGVPSETAQKQLREKHKILTLSQSNNKRAPEIHGLRITPNVFTTPGEIDRLVAALRAG